MKKVQLYDTTLRDGAQQAGISFSVEDKLKIARKLDELGIHYIEGGWPGSNPKDEEFFRKARGLRLSRASLAAFGSTRRPGTRAAADANLKALVEAQTPVVTIVGKSWDGQVTRVLETTLEENLAMIADSIRFLKSKGIMVFFDAEHFFDGFKANPDYALETAAAAEKAGADCIVLCDTNGGSLPDEVAGAVRATRKRVSTAVGIHAHNDGELAVAISLAAVGAGATHVQGTINGYGERCGNASLCSIIPALDLKMGLATIGRDRLVKLTEVSRHIGELANLRPFPRQPYVGTGAFTHKAGLHVSAVNKWTESYQHIDPAAVGNSSGVLVSELSGVSNIVQKARERGLPISRKGGGPPDTGAGEDHGEPRLPVRRGGGLLRTAGAPGPVELQAPLRAGGFHGGGGKPAPPGGRRWAGPGRGHGQGPSGGRGHPYGLRG